jgi:thiol-disulfide isomerase/thioredoxin
LRCAHGLGHTKETPMQLNFRQLFPMLMLSLTVSATLRGVEELRVGDDAPKLFISKWLNGDAVGEFEKGKVYVVECWATWCGPCREAIPHVSELNTKYKDKGVVFIGLNVWERAPEGVEKFVKQMGQTMNYRVAMDDPAGMQGKTATAWLAASGQHGIPCTYIVDKNGKLAWFGHPMGMERIIAQVVAGTYDAKKEAQIRAARNELERKMEEAANNRDVEKQLKLADEMVALDPTSAPEMGLTKFSILLDQKKYDEAYVQGRKVEELFKDDWDTLNGIAWGIMDKKEIEKKDYKLVMDTAKRADELTGHAKAEVLDTLARAYFETGDEAKALELQTLAVSKADDDLKQKLDETLKKYKKAVEKKSKK